MKHDVTLWYKECAVCATSKPPPSRPHGLLDCFRKLLLLAPRIWWPSIYYQACPQLQMVQPTFSRNGRNAMLCQIAKRKLAWTLYTIISSPVLGSASNYILTKLKILNLFCFRKCVNLPASTKHALVPCIRGPTASVRETIARSYKCYAAQLTITLLTGPRNYP